MPTSAGSVMNLAAALLNDRAKQKYTYAVQLDYLKIALMELSELLELSNIPVTNEVSAVLTVPQGTTQIGYATVPALPAALTELVNVHESDFATKDFYRISPVDFLPAHLFGTTNHNFGIYAWRNNFIELPLANGIKYLKLDYIQSLKNNVVDENSMIGITNGESFLHYRTAGLCAWFVDENKERADVLNNDATLAIERATGIAVKGKQNLTTRRRPFRSSFRRS